MERSQTTQRSVDTQGPVATGGVQALAVDRPNTLFGVPMPTVSYFVLYLVAVDTWLTDQALSSKRGVELNPIMDRVYHSGGVLAFLAFKHVLTGI